MKITVIVVFILIALTGMVMVSTGPAMAAFFFALLGFGGFFLMILWLGRNS